MEKLYSILEPYYSWWNNEGEEKNLEARKALQEFYAEFKKLKPSKKYERRDVLHMSYIFHLVKIKKALVERKYMRVCNELISLMHYEPFLQGRIYYNVLKLLEDEVIQDST